MQDYRHKSEIEKSVLKKKDFEQTDRGCSGRWKKIFSERVPWKRSLHLNS